MKSACCKMALININVMTGFIHGHLMIVMMLKIALNCRPERPVPIGSQGMFFLLNVAWFHEVVEVY